MYMLTNLLQVVPSANLEYYTVHKNHRRLGADSDEAISSDKSIADEKALPLQ
jgi:hypothetical protein